MRERERERERERDVYDGLNLGANKKSYFHAIFWGDKHFIFIFTHFWGRENEKLYFHDRFWWERKKNYFHKLLGGFFIISNSNLIFTAKSKKIYNSTPFWDREKTLFSRPSFG